MSHYGPVYRNNYRSIDTKGRWLADWLVGWLAGECLIAGYTSSHRVCRRSLALVSCSPLSSSLPLFFSGDLFTIQRTSHREPRKKDRKAKRERRKREREREREEKGSASQSVDGGDAPRWKGRLFVCRELLVRAQTSGNK